MNRPPPYFPQNQLSPPDDNRYRKFKIIVAAVGLGLFALIAGLLYGLFKLIGYLFG
jgi:hypothetical protein